jgi:hypothetical protein
MKDEARALSIQLKQGDHQHIDRAAELLVKLAAELENMEQQFDLAIEFLAKCNNMTKVKK